MNQMQTFDIANKQRAFLFTGVSKEIAFRIENLKVLKKAIENNEKRILAALKSDLGKPEIEAYGNEIAPETSQVVANIIKENFEQAYIAVVEGGVEETQRLFSQKFDSIFFTGGTRVGLGK